MSFAGIPFVSISSYLIWSSPRMNSLHFLLLHISITILIPSITVLNFSPMKRPVRKKLKQQDSEYEEVKLMDQLRTMEPGCLDAYPQTTAFLARFEALPKIAAYMASDRFMRRPINNKSAAFF